MNGAESKYFNTAAKMDDALIALLETKSFDYITVKEICEKAGVNRSTFYLHYENIGELLDETINRLLDDFLSCFSVDFFHDYNAVWRLCGKRTQLCLRKVFESVFVIYPEQSPGIFHSAAKFRHFWI